MVFPPAAVVNGQVIDAPYFNTAFTDANTLITAAQSAASGAATAIAAAQSTATANVLAKFDGTGALNLKEASVNLAKVADLATVQAASPGLSVVVSAGTWVRTDNLPVPVAQQTLAIAAAPGGSNVRWDSVYVDTLGIAHVAQGTPALVGAVAIPIVPDGTYRVAIVFMQNAVTGAIYNEANVPGGGNFIRDMRFRGAPGLPMDGTLSSTKLKELAPSTSGLAVIIAAGQFPNASRLLTNFAQQSVVYGGGGANPTIPTGGAGVNSRWDTFSSDPLGNLIVTMGTQTVAGGGAPPAWPYGNFPICYAFVLSGATAIAANFSLGSSFIQDTIRARAFAGVIPSDGSLLLSAIKEFSPSATGASMVVTVQPGEFYNTIGVDVACAGGATGTGVTAITAPAGGTNQYYLLSADGTTGALTNTPGTAAASPAKPTLPTGNFPIALVYVPAGATAIYPYASFVAGVVPAGQGYVLDTIRFRSVGGAGGAGAVTTTANVKDTDASYNDTFKASPGIGYISPNVLSTSPAFISASGNIVTINATAGNPMVLGANGNLRKATTTQTASAAGLAVGAVYLMAIGGASTGITFALRTTPTPQSSFEVYIANFVWDGTNLSSLPDLTPIISLLSTQVPLLRAEATVLTTNPTYPSGLQTAFASIGSWKVPESMNVSPSFIVPPNCVALILNKMIGIYNANGAGSSVFCWAALDGTTGVGGSAANAIANSQLTTEAFPTAAGAYRWAESQAGFYSIPAGTHTLTQVIQTINGTGAVSLDLYTGRKVEALIFHT